MSQDYVIYPKVLLGFGNNWSGYLSVIIKRVGMVDLGSTKATDEILKKCAELMKEIQEHPEAEYFISDDTFKDIGRE